MKMNSNKIRTVVALQVLYKYSDKNHRACAKKVNDFLKPYDLDCKNTFFRDTLKKLRYMGFNLKSESKTGSSGVWLENRPLQDRVLNNLVLSVCTNPLLSNTEVNEILSDLKQLITVYQEPVLNQTIVCEHANNNPALCEVYSVTCKAINENMRVQYQFTAETLQKPCVYMPKCFVYRNGRIYLIGFDCRFQKPVAVDLSTASEARIMRIESKAKYEHALEVLSTVNLEEFIKENILT